MKLADKIAVVTGASAGMGKAISLLYAKEGATVIAVARREERLKELEEISQDLPGKIHGHRADVSDVNSMEDMMACVIDKFGRIDVLVNNAGIMDEMTSCSNVSDELWNRVMDVNLTGPFVLCRAALKQMLEQGSGNIINVASVGGIQGSRAGAAYTASKFGLVGLTKSIGFMYATEGIRCNAICPGGVATEIHEAGISNPDSYGLAKAMSGAGNNPRTGDPEEVATVALFLATEDSSFVNGASLVVDGGWTAY